MLTRQRKWQLKQLAAGRCQNCGKPKDGPWKALCTICTLKNRMNSRRYKVAGAWKLGGPGRTPLEILERRAK